MNIGLYNPEEGFLPKSPAINKQTSCGNRQGGNSFNTHTLSKITTKGRAIQYCMETSHKNGKFSLPNERISSVFSSERYLVERGT